MSIMNRQGYIDEIPIVLHKDVEYPDAGGDYENHPHDAQQPKYRCGFRVGGGIDQDLQKCPYGYSDNGAYVTFVYPQSPAEECGLRVNDKLVQVNGHDLQFVTHRKLVEIIHRYPVLNMLIHRPSRTSTSSVSSGSARPSLPSMSSVAGQNGAMSPPRHSPAGAYQEPPAPHYAPNPYPQGYGSGGRR